MEIKIEKVSYQNKKNSRILEAVLANWFRNPKELNLVDPTMSYPFRYNKWRAMKDGTKGKLIDFGKNVELTISDLMDELLDFVDDVVDELGTRNEVEYIKNIIKEGSSADRQLEKFAKTGDLKDVVDMLIKDTIAGC